MWVDELHTFQDVVVSASSPYSDLYVWFEPRSAVLRRFGKTNICVPQPLCRGPALRAGRGTFSEHPSWSLNEAVF
eukprot:4082882-Heterocapsa_arctica.AAC.1